MNHFIIKRKALLSLCVILVLGLAAVIVFRQYCALNDSPVTIQLKSDSSGNLVKIFINNKEYNDIALGFQQMQSLHKKLYDKINSENPHWEPYRFRKLPWGKPNVVVLMDPQLKYKHLWTVIACFTEYVQPNEFVEIPFDKSRIIIKSEDGNFINRLDEQLYHLQIHSPVYIFKLGLISDERETDSIILPARTDPHFVDTEDKRIIANGDTCDLLASPGLYIFITSDNKVRHIFSNSPESPDELWKRLKKPLYNERFDFHIICHDAKVNCETFMSVFTAAKKADFFDYINILVLDYPTEKTFGLDEARRFE